MEIMSKIRLGIIGAGGIVCRLHLPGLVGGDDFEVALLGGRKEHRLKYECEKFGISRWTRDYDEIVYDDSFDAIQIGPLK